MKKQKIQLVIMIVLIVFCALAYVMLNRYSQKKQEEELGDAAASETICQIAAEDIQGFSYKAGDETYSYRKDGDQWVCEGYEGLDLSEAQITALLSNVTAIECDEVLKDVEDYSQFGFDEPSNVITVVTNDETITITIGNYNSTAYCYYYMTSLSEDVYAGNAAVCTSFMQTPDYYQETETETGVSENVTN